MVREQYVITFVVSMGYNCVQEIVCGTGSREKVCISVVGNDRTVIAHKTL